jgi:hypothetical protein
MSSKWYTSMGFNLKSPEALQPIRYSILQKLGPGKCNFILDDVCSLGHLLPEQARHINDEHFLRKDGLPLSQVLQMSYIPLHRQPPQA